MRITIALVGISLSAAACSSDVVAPLDKANGEPVQTDAVSYTARSDGFQYSFKVVTTFRNTLDRTIYLDRCNPDSSGPMYGVIVEDSSVESAFGPMWGCAGWENEAAAREFAVAP